MSERELNMLFGGNRPGSGLTSNVVPLLIVLGLVVVMLALAALIVSLERRLEERDRSAEPVKPERTGGFPVIPHEQRGGASPVVRPVAVRGNGRGTGEGRPSPRARF